MSAPIAWRAEEAAINGFPPLRQIVFGDWLLRFSGSIRRTANSITPLRLPSGDVAALIESCETLYRAQGQPAIFRIPSFLPGAIDQELATRGYTAEGESCIIEGPLDPIAAAAAPFGGIADVKLSSTPTADWAAAMAKLQAQTAEYHAVYRLITGSVVLPAAFAQLSADGEPVALAYGVIHRGLLCYESVVTDERRRRQGFSRRVLAALAIWARDNGATAAGLQVEASNTPARSLYHSIGMATELHRYHYRRQPG